MVVMTAYGTVEAAVEAMREGAYDFITKPLKRAHVVRVVAKALEKQSLLVENRTLEGAARGDAPPADRRSVAGDAPHAGSRAAGGAIDGDGAAARRIGHRQRAARAADPRIVAARGASRSSRSTARRSPKASSRASCSATRKARSPARSPRRDGRFALADGGTLFLDEIGEIPLSVQVKLLRVLQEGEIERLGRQVAEDRHPLGRRDQQRSTARGEPKASFREDLYYRLNVIALNVPPLRDRRDDIPLLVEHFLARFREKNGKAVVGLHARRARRAHRLRLAGQRARARERHRARRRAHEVDA